VHSRFKTGTANTFKPLGNQYLGIVLDLVMNFALAGRDGTICTMSWALYELTKHPSVADRIREEV
jgi:hypothetical protein